MHKPSSVRTAESLLYLQFILMLFNVARFVWMLASPAPQGPAQAAAQPLAALFGLTVSALLGVATGTAIWSIRRRRRYLAVTMVALMDVWWLLTANLLLLVVGAAIIILLFVRSSKAYFSQALPSGQKQSGEHMAAASEQVSPLPNLDGKSPAARMSSNPIVEIRAAGPADAETVHALMMAAFEEYRHSIPPSTALEETVASVREALQAGQGAAILYEEATPAATLRFTIEEDAVYFFRLSVLPSRRKRGYAKRLVKWIEQMGRGKGMNVSRCKVRQNVQNNGAMYLDMGYEIVDQELVVRPAGSVKTLTMEKKLGV